MTAPKAVRSVTVGRLAMPVPVLLASGPFGFGGRYPELFDVKELGAVTLKGAAPDPWPGNAPPRVAPIRGGLLNAIGLENPGIEAVLRGPAKELAARGARIVINVIGHSVEEFETVAIASAESSDVRALELNVSCPNIPDGLRYGTDPKAVYDLVRRVRKRVALPLWVKLPPAPPDRPTLARAAEEAGADALSLVNTLPGLSLSSQGRPRLGQGAGGLSGAALKPVALLAVAECAQAVDIDVIGMGGIATVRDAEEFLSAGAKAIAVGTALFKNPLAAVEIARALTERAPYRLGFASPSHTETSEVAPCPS